MNVREVELMLLGKERSTKIKHKKEIGIFGLEKERDQQKIKHQRKGLRYLDRRGASHQRTVSSPVLFELKRSRSSKDYIISNPFELESIQI